MQVSLLYPFICGCDIYESNANIYTDTGTENLSEYELFRLQKIARNKAKLRALGLDELKKQLTPPKTTQRNKRKSTEPILPSRSSTRLKGLNPNGTFISEDTSKDTSSRLPVQEQQSPLPISDNDDDDGGNDCSEYTQDDLDLSCCSSEEEDEIDERPGKRRRRQSRWELPFSQLDGDDDTELRNWKDMFKELNKYKYEHGHATPSLNDSKNRELAIWTYEQRIISNEGMLDKTRRKCLLLIGFILRSKANGTPRLPEIMYQSQGYSLSDVKDVKKKRLLLSMALVRTNPRTPPSCYPSHGTVLADRFHWTAYPPLDSILRKNMKRYCELSTDKCQSRDQQEFINRLVHLIRKEATKYGWEFDKRVFEDKKIRDRIRNFYKTNIQNAKKRLETMLKNPEKKANIKALAEHYKLIEQKGQDEEGEYPDEIKILNNIGPAAEKKRLEEEERKRISAEKKRLVKEVRMKASTTAASTAVVKQQKKNNLAVERKRLELARKEERAAETRKRLESLKARGLSCGIGAPLNIKPLIKYIYIYIYIYIYEYIYIYIYIYIHR